jgi:hypothetical protein
VSDDVGDLDTEQLLASTVPVVSLARLVAAATRGRRYPSGVSVVQAALVAMRFVRDSAVTPGMFDSATMIGYRKLQAHLGFSARFTDGVPDWHSLSWLSLRTRMFDMDRVPDQGD